MQGEVGVSKQGESQAMREKEQKNRNDPLVKLKETSAVPMQTKSVTRKTQMMKKIRNLDDTCREALQKRARMRQQIKSKLLVR